MDSMYFVNRGENAPMLKKITIKGQFRPFSIHRPKTIDLGHQENIVDHGSAEMDFRVELGEILLLIYVYLFIKVS